MSSDSETADKIGNMRLWECGDCRDVYATRDEKDTHSCPYCGSVVAVAAEELYTLAKQDADTLAGPEESEQ